MSIEVEVRGVERVREYFATRPAKVKVELTKALDKSAITLQRAGREEAPVDRGPLRNSIGVRHLNMAVAVGPSAKYAVAVHEGTKPHFPPIKAFTGKEESLDLWARRHGMPAYPVALAIARRGTKPNKYMERAADKSRDDVQRFFNQAVDRIVEDA